MSALTLDRARSINIVTHAVGGSLILAPGGG